MCHGLFGTMASRRKTQKKSTDENAERIHVRIPVDLATKLRVKCAEERKALADGVAEAIRGWVEPRKS